MASNETEAEKRTLEYMRIMHSISEDASDSELVITSGSVLDFYLRRILKAFLVEDAKIDDELFDNPYAPFGGLAGKAKAAYYMGLISSAEVKEIDAVRKVRNVFAHNLGVTFEHPDVKKLCAKPPIYDGRLCDRDAFLHLAMNTGIHLIYRDLDIAEHRRAPRKEARSEDVKTA